MNSKREKQPFDQGDFVSADDDKVQTPLQGKQVFDEQSLTVEELDNELAAMTT